MARYEPDGTATVIGASGDHPFPPGSRWTLDGPSLLLHVQATGRPARIDDYGSLPGTIAAVAHEAGFRSAIGAPIIVDGRTWGAIIAISTEPEPIPVPEPAPKPKPEPEVKKPEPPKPEPEVKKPEPPKPVAKPKPPTPKPVQEAKKPEEPKQPSFLKNIEKWKATTETASTEPPKQQPAPQPTAQPSSVQDQLARNELSELIRRKVESCWNVPVGARDAGDLLVEIRVVLNRDGSVISADIVDSARASADTFYRAAAESARRAVRTCSPFNELPADRYDIWQTLTLRFNPKEMLGT
jgi:outer membrane biosynthesis protein TonB